MLQARNLWHLPNESVEGTPQPVFCACMPWLQSAVGRSLKFLAGVEITIEIR